MDLLQKEEKVKNILMFVLVAGMVSVCEAKSEPISSSPGDGAFIELRYYPNYNIGGKPIIVAGGEEGHATVLIEYPTAVLERTIMGLQAEKPKPKEERKTSWLKSVYKFLASYLFLPITALMIALFRWSTRIVTKNLAEKIDLPNFWSWLNPIQMNRFFHSLETPDETEAETEADPPASP